MIYFTSHYWKSSYNNGILHFPLDIIKLWKNKTFEQIFLILIQYLSSKEILGGLKLSLLESECYPYFSCNYG